MPRDSKGKRKEGSIRDKVKVTELHAKGHSYGEIARETNYIAKGAQKVIKVWEDEERVESKATQRGRKPKSDEYDTVALAASVEQEPQTILEDITDSSGLNVCSKTVGRALRAKNYYSY